MIPVALEQLGARRQARVTVAADDRLELVTYEGSGLEPTPAIGEFRDERLGPQVSATGS